MVVESEHCVLFWGGWPSQWAPSPFQVQGIWYNCAEQYMMAEKARMFSDARTLDAIMLSRDPKQQKSLGRSVCNFDQGRWEAAVQDILFRGNVAKFEQNDRLKRLLLATHPKVLAEASPYDVIYGIGLAQHDPRAQDSSLWRGTNLLGTTLMRVRDHLLAAQDNDMSE